MRRGRDHLRWSLEILASWKCCGVGLMWLGYRRPKGARVGGGIELAIGPEVEPSGLGIMDVLLGWVEVSWV